MSDVKPVVRISGNDYADVVGNGSLVDGPDTNYRRAFENDPSAEAIRGRVRFPGTRCAGSVASVVSLL